MFLQCFAADVGFALSFRCLQAMPVLHPFHDVLPPWQIGSVEDWNAKVLQRIKDREACNAIVIDPNVPGVDKMVREGVAGVGCVGGEATDHTKSKELGGM